MNDNLYRRRPGGWRESVSRSRLRFLKLNMRQRDVAATAAGTAAVHLSKKIAAQVSDRFNLHRLIKSQIWKRKFFGKPSKTTIRSLTAHLSMRSVRRKFTANRRVRQNCRNAKMCNFLKILQKPKQAVFALVCAVSRSRKRRICQ